MRIAVVTGGAGFIGSHMVDLLIDEGFEVRVIDDLSVGKESHLAQHKGKSQLKLELKDIRTIPETSPVFKGAELVFHFAGKGDIVPSIEQPVEYMSVNVQGTVKALEGARHAGAKKFVYAASSSCYGVATELPTKESTPIAPMYPYALSKYQGEMAVLHWGHVYGLPVNAIRIFNAYGMRSSTKGAYGAVFGVFLKQKLAGKPFTVVGDGKQTRDFVYVTDVAQAFYQVACKASPGEIFNLGSGNPQSINRLVELLGGPVVYVPKRPREPDCTWADVSKLKALGWAPRVSFEQGVGTMVGGIEYWKDAPLWDQEKIAQATRTWFDYFS